MVSHLHTESAQAFYLPPSREAALEQLRAFLPMVANYSRERNFDRGNRSNVSRLSPYLRYRLITEEEVVQTIIGEIGETVGRKFIEEVCWRTYFKGYLETFPRIWSTYADDVQTQAGSQAGDLWARVEQARQGRTGITCFDTWINELRREGYLHNHVRMWFASTWIFTLRLPWQLGAALFMEFLRDADPAANTLGWRWVAGLHTRGKAYMARASNIAKYTEGRFNPQGELTEDSEPLEPDGPFPKAVFSPTAPFRIGESIDLSLCPAGLLVTPEDLSVEQSLLRESPFSSIAVLIGLDTTAEPHCRLADPAFLIGAVDDAGTRLAAHWGGEIREIDQEIKLCDRKACPAHVGLHERMRVYRGSVDNWVESVVNWAMNETLHSVWVVEPPVGPYRDRLARLNVALKRRGIELCVYRRRWDSMHWPHAGGGYFTFRKNLFQRIARITDDRGLRGPHEAESYQ